MAPGPWAGTVTHTDREQVYGMVSQEEWDKTRLLIWELEIMLIDDFLPLQRLLVIRGFLIYVVRTYPWLNPYIKGLHLTIDSWRPGREKSGYKMKGKELERALAAWADRERCHAGGEQTKKRRQDRWDDCQGTKA